MKTYTKKFVFALAVPLLLAACATGGGSSDSSGKSEKIQKSKICKGKIGDQSGTEVLLNLAKGDPSTFACNASYQYALSLRSSYAALGRAEDEKEAALFIESLRNGTGDPSSIKNIAATDATTDQKEKEQRDIAEESASARKQALVEAQKQRNDAIKNSAAGVASFIIGVNQVQAGLQSDDPLAKLGAAAKIIELTQVLSVLPAIAEANDKFNANMAHLDKVLNVEKADSSALKKAMPD